MKRKIDNRVRILIENGALKGHRSLFVVVGDRARDQVVYLHHMLSKTNLKQANVLWCYKKSLAFSSHRKKRMKQLQAKVKTGDLSVNEDDPFEMFVSMTEIRYCYYKETHKILGNTFKMCVLQDFEALTPNILCRTMETVEGGGIIVILLQTVTSLRQLYTISMDVHSRYRTEAHCHVVPRFNERFILSLPSCSTCAVLDDQLRILPLSSHLKDLQPIPKPSADDPLLPQEQELRDLKESLKGNPPIGILVDLCKTLDQAKSVLQFIVAITEKTLRTTVALTAGRGRGKSAALGISVAGAIAFGYSNIFVTSPSPENLNTFFEFVLKSLNAMGYEEHLNYQVLRSSDPQFNKCVMRVTVTRDRRQVLQYILPNESHCLGQAEIVVIDEAAAIPLPLVQKLLGPYLVFLSSTVSGYEGTGRSLSLKLIDQLRREAKYKQTEKNAGEETQTTGLSRVLQEVTLEESIRYKSGDPVEGWLHDILCLEASIFDIPGDLPPPDKCQLFYVNRDTLFAYHKVSEKFLAQIMGLLVSSHYRNTPDDLQMLSDAPAYHLFVLLPPQQEMEGDSLPLVLTVIQVALEGKISKDSVMAALTVGEKPSGDLVPWTVSNQFQNYDFPQLSGARVVRIATHPHIQGKGYGSHALSLLEAYYAEVSPHADYGESSISETTHLNLVQDEQVGLLEEKITPNPHLQPLLQALDERSPEPLHYLAVSFGATQQLLTFWKRAGFTPVYLSQVANSITGEFTIIMLKVLSETKENRATSWLSDLWFDFRKRMISLLGLTFRELTCKFALSIISSNIYKKKSEVSDLLELDLYVTCGDTKRLDEFLRHQCDALLITDIISGVAHLYFSNKLGAFKLKPVQTAILCGIGIQHKTAQTLADELGVDRSIIMSQFHNLIFEVTRQIKSVRQNVEGRGINGGKSLSTDEKFASSIEESVKIMKDKEASDREKVSQMIDITQYKIKTKEEEELVTTKKTKSKKRLLVGAEQEKKSKIPKT
ncbi:RNA cytidine acetyltransferase isoform X2 [Macrobrachium rosenbergii]|uniref:RNA cytidine acetyltransferase isoform X2 n=1 Tax=Macrobrachium rosenbergii TaxID=79674 RepID=UPI0034D7B37C